MEDHGGGSCVHREQEQSAKPTFIQVFFLFVINANRTKTIKENYVDGGGDGRKTKLNCDILAKHKSICVIIKWKITRNVADGNDNMNFWLWTNPYMLWIPQNYTIINQMYSLVNIIVNVWLCLYVCRTYIWWWCVVYSYYLFIMTYDNVNNI